jgi:hypothetical protein
MSLPYKERKTPQYTGQDASPRHVTSARAVIGTSSREGPQLAHSISAEGPESTHCCRFRAIKDGSPSTHCGCSCCTRGLGVAVVG